MTTAGADRVYLHLGAPKTGTTYLQEILWNNRERLAAAGVSYPGGRSEAHFHAAMDLQNRQFQADHHDENVPGAWRRLVEHARRTEGTVVISHELFCTARPEEIDRALRDLSFAEVHLVCTARDLARQLPAVWQEDVKNRHTVSFGDFVAGVRGTVQPPGLLSDLFWRRQDLPEVLAKWSRFVPAERVHIVTVPPAGEAPDLVWQRFAQLIGVPASDYDTTVKRQNRSLGVAETQLLRRLNETLDGHVSWLGYDSVVKFGLAARTFGARKPNTPIRIPEEHYEWIHREAERAHSRLREAGYDVVGDLDDLLPRRETTGTVHPDDADPNETLDVAVEAISALVQDLGNQVDNSRPFPTGYGPVGTRQSIVHLCYQHPALYKALEAARATKRTVRRFRAASR